MFARRTIATAFQRISRRIRRSMRLVAGELRLLLRADGVDVAGVGERRQPDLELARPLQQLEQEEPGAGLALLLDDVVERADPVGRLLLVDVRGAAA